MFLGRYKQILNKGSRLVLPSKIRDQIKAGEVMLTRGEEGCIWGFTREEFDREAEKYLELPLQDETGRKLRRRFFPLATMCDLDRHGRLVVPASLVEFAGIKDLLEIIGAGDHFEIWEPKLLDRVLKSYE